MKYLLLLLYIGLLLLIFFGLPDKVLYSQDIIKWIPFVLIFGVQTYLLYYLLLSFKVNPKYIIGSCALSALIIGPSFGFYRSYQEKLAFQKSGKETKGVIYKKWYSLKKNSEWLVRCHYMVDDVTYSTFSETDKYNKYKVGDTLTVIYIDGFPQKCKIKELD